LAHRLLRSIRARDSSGFQSTMPLATSSKRGSATKLTKAELIVQADEMISAQLGNAKHFCDPRLSHTVKICDEVFSAISSNSCENHSLLLLGEAGAGKTHIVEWCIQKLRKAHPSSVVLRASGGAYASDVECLRHLATQLSDRLVSAPSPTASFEQNMEWILNIFKGSFKHASAMVMVIDQFEYFCSRTRQTLLYNLFDISQKAGVHISVIGTSTKLDAMNSLEKRIRSRFSMRHLHTFLPHTMDDLIQVLMAKLRLPETCGLPTDFLASFHTDVENALRSKTAEWEPQVELGRPPSWFLSRCRPIMALLPQVEKDSAAPEQPVAKKQRVVAGCLPSCASYEETLLLLDGLTQDEHVMLVALHRLRQRGMVAMLSLALHEIQVLHESSCYITTGFNQNLYAAGFDRLLSLRLVEIASGSGSADIARQHLPCRIAVETEGVFGELVYELGRASSVTAASQRNPLRRLPSAMQQWAMQRQRNARGAL